MDLKVRVLHEESQSGKIIYCMIPFAAHSQADNSTDVDEICGCQRLGLGEIVKLLRWGMREFRCGDGTVLQPDCGVGYSNIHM